MAQAARAIQPADEQEQLPQQEARLETKSTPEHSPVEKALESGSPEKVVSIFRGKAVEEVAALKRLGKAEVNPQILPVTPEVQAVMSQMEAANDSAYQKVKATEAKAVETVQKAMGVAAPEAAPAPTPAVEVAKIVPVGVAAVEAPKAKVDTSEFEEQRDAAAIQIKENHEALTSFAKEHGLNIDPQTLAMSAQDLAKLTNVEQMYVSVLQAKHQEAQAFTELAEAHIQGDQDAINEHARASALAHTKASALEAAYMSLPEISGSAPSNPTGGSYGGEAFNQPPLAAAPPSGPKGPEGPKGPTDVMPATSPFAANERPPSRSSTEPLYNDNIVVGPRGGIADIKPVKAEGPDIKPEPSFIRRWINRQLSGGSDRH